MDQDYLDEILKKNPNIDRTALERCGKAVQQLADVGITVGGYRLEPALGGVSINNSEQSLYRSTRAQR